MSNDNEKHVKVLVLGAGPAGLAAALYAARAELNPVVLTGMQLGGQAALTHTIENYPGFPEGVGGAQLGELFQKQAENFGAKVEFDMAHEVDLSQRPYKVTTDSGEYKADTLILTTGANPTHLNVPGEVELTGRGVSYCATCDGFFFRGKDVLVVGGGDSAAEEALFLTRYASRVRILHRRDKFRASKILQDRVFANEKIEVLWNTAPTTVEGKDGKVTGVRTRDTVTGAEGRLETDGVFIFVGHIPNNDLYPGKFDLDEDGHLITDRKLRTNVPGIFAAGEIQDKVFKQVATSVGQGCAAAMSATRFLEDLEADHALNLAEDPREFAVPRVFA